MKPIGSENGLAEAAALMETEEVAMQLRMLQTLAQVGTERNNTIILPIPIDLLRSALGGMLQA